MAASATDTKQRQAKTDLRQQPRTGTAPREPDATVHDDTEIGSPFGPSHEEIAILAYSYWLDDGQREGSADEHWLRAERELKGRTDAGAGRPAASAASDISRM